MARNYPFFSQEEVTSSLAIPQIQLQNPFANAEQTVITVLGIEPNPRSPYTSWWNLAIQQRIGRHLNFEIEYNGNKTTGALRRLPGNIPVAGPGDIQARRPNPTLGEFFITSTDGNRSENSLNLNLERQLSDGFSVKSGFRWSRRINDVVWRGAV